MRHIMLDLETLGLKLGCGIVEIGWCTFSDEQDPKLASECFELLIPVAQNLLYGFEADQETVQWWLEHQGGFRYWYGNKRPKATFPQILSEFASQMDELWYEDVRTIWAKPLHFDILILKAAYEKLGVELPIILRSENFHCWQDFLTLSHTYKQCLPHASVAINNLIVDSRAPHHAVVDAKNQAFRCSLMLSNLRRLENASMYLHASNQAKVDVPQPQQSPHVAKATKSKKNERRTKR